MVLCLYDLLKDKMTPWNGRKRSIHRAKKLEPIIVLVHHQHTGKKSINQPTNQLQVHAQGFEPQKWKSRQKRTRMPKRPAMQIQEGREPWGNFILGIINQNTPFPSIYANQCDPTKKKQEMDSDTATEKGRSGAERARGSCNVGARR